MIIRSQDKTMIMNFNNASNIYKQGFEVWVNTYHGIAKIGEYSTEEKAIKVLDMICDHNFWCRDVFQMPTDEEVEV